MKLRAGTLFSGIGAFEQALKQMKISHEIVFACDRCLARQNDRRSG